MSGIDLRPFKVLLLLLLINHVIPHAGELDVEFSLSACKLLMIDYIGANKVLIFPSTSFVSRNLPEYEIPKRAFRI